MKNQLTYTDFKQKIQEYLVVEKHVSQTVLDRKEELFIKLKKRKQEFIDRYGKDNAEDIMHATAMNMAKRELGESVEEMTDEEICETVYNELVDCIEEDMNFELELENGSLIKLSPEDAIKILENSNVEEMIDSGLDADTFLEYLDGI